MEVAEPFPRGRITPAGSNKLSLAPEKHISRVDKNTNKTKKNEQDFLFGHNKEDTTQLQPTHNKRRKVVSTNKEIVGTHVPVASTNVNPLGGGGVIPSDQVRRRPAIIESVGFSKLTPKHTKVLGIVRDVTEDYAIISLPNMLTGFIKRSSSSSSDIPITHQISKNTILAVSIQATAVEHVKNEATPKRRIEVSIHPRHMNQNLTGDILHEQMRIRGVIHSKEDHGCIVHVHIPGVTCFLPFHNVHNYNNSNTHENEDDEYDESSDDDDNSSTASVSSNKERHQHGDDAKNVHYCLRPGRIYDFVITKITRDSSTSNRSGASRIMIQLSLPDTKAAAKLLELSPSMAQANQNQLASHTLKTISPGMLVKCYIEGYAKNGLLVSFFLGLFRASIEANHMGGYYIEEGKAAVDWRKIFRESGIRHVVGRIIVADPSSKIIRLSLLPHLLNLTIPAELPPVGTVLQNAVVLRIDKGIGALLAIPHEFAHALQPSEASELVEGDEEEEDEDENEDEKDGMERQQRKKRKKSIDGSRSGIQSLYTIPQHLEASKIRCVYVHISKASDASNTIASEGKKDPILGAQLLKEMEFAKQFKVGSTVPAVRIISTQSWVENIASGATAPSIVEANVLSHSDIKPGFLYRNVPIISTGNFGILVSLGQNIKAVCPFLHMYDKVPAGSSSENIMASRAFAKMFVVGKKINVRCLEVDPENKRCSVTHKPSLVKDTGFIVCSYEDLPPPHEVVKGYVSKCVSNGLMISFYNNIYGWCPAKSLQRDLGVENVTVSYKVGDVVKCRIIKATFNDNNRWYLTVSLDITDRAISAATAGDNNKDESSVCTNEETLRSKLLPGTVLPSGGKIVEMVNSQKSSAGRLFCGYAMVRYADKNRGLTFECRLPYELVFDSPADDSSQQEIPIQARLDELVCEKLRVGKQVNAEAVVIGMHNADGINLPFISIKPRIVSAAVAMAAAAATDEKMEKSTLLLPSSAADLYVGANAVGYVYHHDERHGAFIRFLNKLTGIVPKSKRGLELPLYHTISCTVGALDATKSPPQILLRRMKSKGNKTKPTFSPDSTPPIRAGDFLGDVEVESVNFLRAKVRLLDSKYAFGRVRARIHVTMALECSLQNERGKEPVSDSKIKKQHPFYRWKVGTIVHKVYCVAVEVRENVLYLELSNVNPNSSNTGKAPSPTFFESEKVLKIGQPVSGIITAILPRSSGLKLQISPGIVCIVQGLELDENVEKLNDMASNFLIGSRMCCSVISVPKGQQTDANDRSSSRLQDFVHLSVVRFTKKLESSKPGSGDLVVGRINTSISPRLPPALMLDLRGGFTGRCCITELSEVDEWENMPLGKNLFTPKGMVESQNEADHESDEDSRGDLTQNGPGFYNGKYVLCRVLPSKKGSSTVEVSLRESRLEGDLDEDATPETNEIVSAYVCETNSKGCFLRLSRSIRGRVILKELSDSFLPDPSTLFPMGRLVIGKVKQVHRNLSKRKANTPKGIETTVDIDMRESSLLDQNKVSFEDIQEGSKHKGVVTRVEKYGVFVRLDGSDVSGMAHLSECSDAFVKHLSDLYDPGDRVKVLVLKVDKEQHRISLGLKASYFEGDLCSDSEEQSDEDSSSEEEDRSRKVTRSNVSMDLDSLDSEDEDFVSKLAKKTENSGGCTETFDEDVSDDHGDNDSFDDESEIEDTISTDTAQREAITALDTNVGFTWTNSDGIQKVGEVTQVDGPISDDDTVDSSSGSSSDENQGRKIGGHKSRRRASQKRKEEKEITMRESALADGTADENPETEKDFERILASQPNMSEYWIKYMAYHLSLADIDAARRVAQRAFDRIEFRQEKEKLNVWLAFLTLELKYGSPNSLDIAMENACKQNNPKQVYLRMCEILEKEVDAVMETGAGCSEAAEKADAMFLKMCKRFKSKKTAWLAYAKFKLKMESSEAANNILKRSLLSLPAYKHVEMVSKVAELEFELGSPERGRTLFLALLAKNPKRLDLLFVFIDKEIKCQNIDGARALFKNINQPCPGSLKMKLNDKQMKSLFKKWYRMEEVYGDINSQNLVKLEATSYVQRAAATLDSANNAK